MAYHEMLKSEGWRYFAKAINERIENKQKELITRAVNEPDIRVINELGRDIQLYNYILTEPQNFIENCERYFKRKESKE